MPLYAACEPGEGSRGHVRSEAGSGRCPKSIVLRRRTRPAASTTMRKRLPRRKKVSLVNPASWPSPTSQRLVIPPDRINEWTSLAEIPRPCAIVSASTIGEPFSKLTTFCVPAIAGLQLKTSIYHTSIVLRLRVGRRREVRHASTDVADGCRAAPKPASRR